MSEQSYSNMTTEYIGVKCPHCFYTSSTHVEILRPTNEIIYIRKCPKCKCDIRIAFELVGDDVNYVNALWNIPEHSNVRW